MKEKPKSKATQSKGTQPKGTRETKKKETKDRILTAALRLFTKKGFYKTTTKEISQKARIAEGTLYNYFKTKEDLALYFFETEIQNCIDWHQQDERVQKAPLPEKLFAITQHSLERLEPYEEFIGAVYMRAFQPRSKFHPLSLDVQELRLKELKFIRGILMEAEEKGEIPPVGDLGTYAIGFGFIGILTYWLNDRSEGKENTLALLDRSLHFINHILQQGSWKW